MVLPPLALWALPPVGWLGLAGVEGVTGSTTTEAVRLPCLVAILREEMSIPRVRRQSWICFVGASVPLFLCVELLHVLLRDLWGLTPAHGSQGGGCSFATTSATKPDVSAIIAFAQQHLR